MVLRHIQEAWDDVHGDDDSARTSGNRICGRVVSESEADELEHHLIEWVRA